VISTLAVAGGVAAAQTGSNLNTGYNSYNKNKTSVSNKMDVKTTNTLGANTNTSQNGYSGSVDSKYNTKADGDAKSGPVNNAAALNVTAHIDNTGSTSCGCAGSNTGDPNFSGTNDTTGYNSTNVNVSKVDTSTKITTTNTVNVNTNTSQSGKSGSVDQIGNTKAGNAESGAVNNSTSEVVDLTIKN